MKKGMMNLTLYCVLQCCASAAFSQSNVGGSRQTLSVNMGQPECNISLTDLYGGHLETGMPKNASYWVDAPPVHSSLGQFGIDFECQVDREPNSVAHDFGAQWDEREKKWRLYYEDENDRKILPSVSRIYQVRSKNAVGFVRTTDQINGEESLCVRFYSFCLFHNRSAVCGSGQSMRLEEPRGDYMPLIINILRSVSFVG